MRLKMKVYENSWIGFDLDGTIAEYGEWRGPEVIGKPIPKMIEKLKDYLNRGFKVKILTARVAGRLYGDDPELEPYLAQQAIIKWCKKHIGQELEVTAYKDYAMLFFYDDRCVQVEKDTGEILGKDFII